MFKSLILICAFSVICLAQQQQPPTITPQQAISGVLNAQAQINAQVSLVLTQLGAFIQKQDSIITVQNQYIESLKKIEVKK